MTKKRIFHKTKRTGIKDYRVMIVIFCVGLIGGIIILRLFTLQIKNYDQYALLASGQYELIQKLFPKRGNIYLEEYNNYEGKNVLFPIATHKTVYEVFIQPNRIENKDDVLDVLTSELGIEDENEINEIKQKIEKVDDPYEPIRKEISETVFQNISEKNIAGIGFRPQLQRFYPEEDFASTVLGFVRNQELKTEGQYGIEGFYDELLAGKGGLVKSEKDAVGRIISVGEGDFEDVQDGSDIVLTIDKSIQFTACNMLKEAMEEYEAEGAATIIVNPKNGHILAMCSFPDFNPNEFSKIEDYNVYNNKNIFEAYEPGSIFKPITMIAAIDQGAVTPYTTYDDKGFVPYNNEGEVDYENPLYNLKNFEDKKYGVQTMTEVLEKSINTGMIFSMQSIGKEMFTQYVKDFGFGKKTGIELDTEVAGTIASLEKPGEIFGATGSFGQGITTTPLQMVMSYAAIANNGRLLKPQIVKEILHSDGTKEIISSKTVGQPVSPRSAELMKAMLHSVVKNGHGTKAGVSGYKIGGKTGTAQVAERGVYGDKTNHSFVGFGPVDDPQFVMIVKLENPQNGISSSQTASPTFGKIAAYILDYMNILPQKD